MAYFVEDYDEAVRDCQRALALDPGFVRAHVCLQGRVRRARQGSAVLDEIEALWRLGGTARTRSDIDEDREIYRRAGLPGLWQAAEHAFWLVFAFPDPVFKYARDLPRYPLLYNRVGLGWNPRAWPWTRNRIRQPTRPPPRAAES